MKKLGKKLRTTEETVEAYCNCTSCFCTRCVCVCSVTGTYEERLGDRDACRDAFIEGSDSKRNYNAWN